LTYIPVKGQPWWNWCTKCIVKHSLLMEGHIEEGIEKAAVERDVERVKQLCELLYAVNGVRKVFEEMHLEERAKLEDAVK